MEDLNINNKGNNVNNFLTPFLIKDKRYSIDQNMTSVKEMGETPEEFLNLNIKRCSYCSRISNFVPITTGRFNEDICPECKRELVTRKQQCQKLADEVVHNVEQLFSITWNKHIKIRKYKFMDLPESELHIGKLKKIIRFIPNGFMRTINKILRKKTKLEYPIWKASIEPNILHIKIGKSACAVSVRSDTPVGIIAAEFVYTIISDYLETRILSMNDEQKSGIAMWYMVHYLYIMDYDRYGNFYDKAIEQFSSLDKSDIGEKNEIFKNWNLEGKVEYLAVRERIHPKNAPIMPINLGINKLNNRGRKKFCVYGK